MSYFKGDSYYEAHVDDVADSANYFPTTEVESDCDFSYRWVDRHYDALQELYELFKQRGSFLFGRAFFQLGDFADFIELIYRKTVI